jgi:hypothetical protein
LFGSFVASLLNVFTTEWLLPALPVETGFRDLYFVGAGTTVLTLIILYFYKEELDVDRMERLGYVRATGNLSKAAV